MKIRVQKSSLMEKLTLAMGTVSCRNTIAAIEGILLETMDEESIRVTTYDMNKGIRAIVHGVTIEEPGKKIINAQRFYQTIRVMPDDEIVIDGRDDGVCEVSCGKTAFSMSCIRGEDFPMMPDLLTERGFRISSPLFRSMIGKVAHSVADVDTRPMLCGIFIKTHEGGLDVVSTDSFTLSLCRQSCEIGALGRENRTDFSFILPSHAIAELMKCLPDGEDEILDLYLSRKHAILHVTDVIFFTRTVDSEYIDYEKVIPQEQPITVRINRERLLSGLEMANVIAEEKVVGNGKSYLKMHVEDRYLTMTSVSVNGKVFDEIDCVHEGPDLEIGFNCRYLINSIRVAEGEDLTVGMSTPTSPVTFRPAEELEGRSFLYMILPVRMNDKDAKNKKQQ